MVTLGTLEYARTGCKIKLELSDYDSVIFLFRKTVTVVAVLPLTEKSASQKSRVYMVCLKTSADFT